MYEQCPNCYEDVEEFSNGDCQCLDCGWCWNIEELEENE